MNIEKKNTLFIIALVLMVLISASAVTFFFLYRHVEEASSTRLQSAYDTIIEVLYRDYRNLLQNTRNIAESPELSSLLKQDRAAAINTYLRAQLTTNGTDLLIVYASGTSQQYYPVSTKSHLSSANVITSDTFDKLIREVRAGEKVARSYAVILDEVLNVVAIPVRDTGGRLDAVLIQGEIISSHVLEEMRKLVQTEIMLFKPNQVISNTLPALNSYVERFSDPDKQSGLLTFELGGSDYYGRIFPLKDRLHELPQAYLLFSVALDTEWKAYEGLFLQAVYAGVLIMLVSALAGIQVSRIGLSRPIRNLARVSHALGEGKLDVEIGQQDRSDEVGDLSRSLAYLQHELQETLREQEVTKERFADFAESSSDWLWETNARGEFSYISSSVEESLGYSPEDLVGSRINDIFTMDRMSEILLRLSPEAEQHTPFKDIEFWVTTAQGYRQCLRFNGTPYFMEGRLMGFRGTARDITLSKKVEERLIRLANKDHLSGLSNRMRFQEDLDREIQVSIRQGTKGAILLIDLDHFKLVNDTAGHAAGDEVIVQVAALLRRLARNVDLVARLSGDEFVIAYVNTDISQLEKKAGEILKKISQLKPIYAGKMLNTTASIGMAVYPDHGDNAVELLAKADTAMYAAKSAGRNQAHLYHAEDMQQELMGSQLVWKERIHDALENDLFVLAYQPIMPTTGEAVSRYEVLVRMKLSENQIHMPGRFIPLAEQFGLIRDLDAWVVRKAIRTLVSQSNAFITFTINLSGLSVGDPVMLELIEEELGKVRIDRKRIVFEVTESAAFQDLGRAVNFIARIKELGCRIALDDFGVGFSSFSYLKQLRADILKIDGSFIRDIHNNLEDQLFVKALIDVARGMGMLTVAEYVESKGAFDVVRTLGVDYAQGHYIGEPVIDEFTE